MSNGLRVGVLILWLANVACVGVNVAQMYNSTSAVHVGFLAAITVLNVNAVIILTRAMTEDF